MLACGHFLKPFDRCSSVYLTAAHPPNLPETLQQQRPLLPQLPPTNLHGDRGGVLDDGDTNHLLLFRQLRDNLLQEDEGLVEVDLPDRFRALYDECHLFGGKDGRLGCWRQQASGGGGLGSRAQGRGGHPWRLFIQRRERQRRFWYLWFLSQGAEVIR